MQYDLIFEGGGAKGLAFLGALESLETHGHQAGRLLGTSAGALTATLIAAGFDAQTIREALTKRNRYGKMQMSAFLDIPTTFDDATIYNSRFGRTLRMIDIPLIPKSAEQKFDSLLIRAMLKLPLMAQLFSFVERGGLYAGDVFVEWLREMLNSDGRNFADLTLREFFQRTGRELSIVSADTTDGRLLILNHRTAPDCPIVWAVRMSLSMPFLWQEVIWQEEWGYYSGLHITGHAIVDGGILSNFPIELFVSRDPFVTSIMGTPETNNLIGCLVDESQPVRDGGKREAPPRQASKTLARILRLINTTMHAHDKFVLDYYASKVVRLPAQGYGTTEFWMSQQRLNALISAGRSAMNVHLSQRAADAHLNGRPARRNQQIDDIARKILSQQAVPMPAGF